MPQDTILIQAFDLLQSLFETRGDHFLLVAASGFGAWVKAGVKQLDNAGGDAGMFHESRPHIILRIRHTNLAQESRQCADERHVAPGNTGMQRERVVAVIFGYSTHNHQESRLKLGTASVEINHAAVCAGEEHIVQPHAGVALRLDVIGALVHDAEAHVFQDRNAFRQRQRARKAPYLQTNALLVFFQPVMKIDAQRPLIREPLNDANIAGGDRGCVGFVEALGECIAIPGEYFTQLVGGVEQC